MLFCLSHSLHKHPKIVRLYNNLCFYFFPLLRRQPQFSNTLNYIIGIYISSAKMTWCDHILKLFLKIVAESYPKHMYEYRSHIKSTIRLSILMEDKIFCISGWLVNSRRVSYVDYLICSFYKILCVNYLQKNRLI